jgi:hypothetical protein
MVVSDMKVFFVENNILMGLICRTPVFLRKG